MRTTLLIHVAAASLALLVGFVALFAAKGRAVHRRSGVVFVYAMVVMALAAAVLAAAHAQLDNLLVGLLTTYLVVTAFAAVRPPTPATRRVEVGAMFWALAIGLGGVALGLGMLAGVDVPSEGRGGVFLVFGSVALLCGAADARTLRAGALRAAPRLRRHLWRMCFALWIASASFFLGQTDEIPAALRAPVLLAIPVLAPLLVMLYWLWRSRDRAVVRGLAAAAAPPGPVAPVAASPRARTSAGRAAARTRRPVRSD